MCVGGGWVGSIHSISLLGIFQPWYHGWVRWSDSDVSPDWSSCWDRSKAKDTDNGQDERLQICFVGLSKV